MYQATEQKGHAFESQAPMVGVLREQSVLDCFYQDVASMYMQVALVFLAFVTVMQPYEGLQAHHHLPPRHHVRNLVNPQTYQTLPGHILLDTNCVRKSYFWGAVLFPMEGQASGEMTLQMLKRAWTSQFDSL